MIRQAPNSFSRQMPWAYYWLKHQLSSIVLRTQVSSSCLISVLHPTRRPAMAVERRSQWLSNARNPDNIEYVYAVDADDEPSLALLKSHPGVIAPVGGKAIRPINLAAQTSSGEILILAMDDVAAPVGWDSILRERLARHLGQEAVLAVSDGHRRDRLIVTAILTRARYLSQGYVLHPDYECCGVYADNEFTDCAYEDGVIVEAFDVIFTHEHPSFEGKPLDEVHMRHNNSESYQRGLELYERRKKVRHGSSINPSGAASLK